MTPLIKRVNEQVSTNQSVDAGMYDSIKDPENVIGLHSSGHHHYMNVFKNLDPSNKHDRKILDKILRGD